MTTTTQPAATTVIRRLPQWQRAALVLLRSTLRPTAWFLPLFLAGLTATVFVVSRFAPMEMSAVQFGFQAVLWFHFGMSVAVLAGYGRLLVANGMTRRSLTAGSLVSTGVTAVVNAVAVVLVLLAESWFYDRLGWFHGLDDGRGAVLETGLWPYVWGAVLMFGVTGLSALLVTATYLRVGGWWGTLCLPLTMAPLMLVGTLVLDHHRQLVPWGLTPDVLGAGRPLLAVVVVAVGVAAYVLLVRRMPISAGSNGQ